MNKQQQFHRKNRQTLRKKVTDELIVITASSMVQATGDQAYQFQQDTSFYYLTGIKESGIVLVIDATDEYLVVPSRDEVRVAFEGSVDHSVLTETSGITQFKEWSELEDRLNTAKSVATLGFYEHQYIESMDMFINPSRQRLHDRLKVGRPELAVNDIRATIALLRMVKQPYEIALIKKAIAATVKVFTAIEKKRATAHNEQDLLIAANIVAAKLNLEHAYDPIVASGQNAITLHYDKNNAPLDRSGMLLLDIGLGYGSYAADITRSVSSSPTTRQKEVLEAVLAVHAFALSVLKPGITMQEYETLVNEKMGQVLIELGLITEPTKEAIRKYYPHRTSHFLGLDVHDVGDYDIPLKKGVVLTVEPGIYIPEENIGIRLEDDVLITKDGNKVLTSALPKDIGSLTIRK